MLTPPSHLSQWHLGVKPGFHPLDHGYDEYLGLPESNDYGCTDSMMGAPDSGCLRWQHDRCPRNRAEAAAPPAAWDNPTCHPGPLNPWNYSLPLLANRSVQQQPADLDGSLTGVSMAERYAAFGARFVARHAAANRPFLLYVAWSHMHVPVVHAPRFTGRSGRGPLGDSLIELDEAAGLLLASLEAAGVANSSACLLPSSKHFLLPCELLLQLPPLSPTLM